MCPSKCWVFGCFRSWGRIEKERERGGGGGGEAERVRAREEKRVEL